tara:strand:- start:919 stop:1287 length:369 start_codon:yes stop_codon:yes gene_type:complete
LPVPPPRDIPDTAKTARIAKLEQQIAVLTKRLDGLKDNDTVAKPFKVQLVTQSKRTGKQIVIGEIEVNPSDGGTYQLGLPDTVVQWLNPQTGVVESQGAFPAGTPVKLVVTPKMLGQENTDE